MKTDRFEMRLDQELAGKIDEWRQRQVEQPSRAEAIRSLVELGLSGSQTSIRPQGYERLMMWMLAEVLKQNPDEHLQRNADLVLEAIYGGHFWAIEWDLPGVVHAGINRPEDVQFVVDVLDMWSFIELGFSRLSKREKDRVAEEVGLIGRNPKFIGFDGNNESELMGIATFMVEKMNRFTSFSGRSFNSHMPKARLYRKMLETFDPMRRELVGKDLTAEQLIQILRRE